MTKNTAILSCVVSASDRWICAWGESAHARAMRMTGHAAMRPRTKSKRQVSRWRRYCRRQVREDWWFVVSRPVIDQTVALTFVAFASERHPDFNALSMTTSVLTTNRSPFAIFTLKSKTEQLVSSHFWQIRKNNGRFCTTRQTTIWRLCWANYHRLSTVAILTIVFLKIHCAVSKKIIRDGVASALMRCKCTDALQVHRCAASALTRFDQPEKPSLHWQVIPRSPLKAHCPLPRHLLAAHVDECPSLMHPGRMVDCSSKAGMTSRKSTWLWLMYKPWIQPVWNTDINDTDSSSWVYSYKLEFSVTHTNSNSWV